MKFLLLLTIIACTTAASAESLLQCEGSDDPRESAELQIDDSCAGPVFQVSRTKRFTYSIKPDYEKQGLLPQTGLRILVLEGGDYVYRDFHKHIEIRFPEGNCVVSPDLVLR